MRYKNGIVLFAVGVILLGSLAALTAYGGSPEMGTRAGEGSDPYCTFDSGDFENHHYIGETISFSVSVSNEYDGAEWEGTGASERGLYECKLTLEYDKVTDADDNIRSVLEPTGAGSATPFNDVTGDGFTISGWSSKTYYRSEDPDNVDLELMVKASGVKPGHYEMPIKLSFRIRLEETEPDVYRMSPVMTQTGHLDFWVESMITGLSHDENTLYGYEDFSTVPVYAGAKYLSLESPTLRSVSGTLDSFTATLALGTQFDILTSTLNIPVLTTTFRSLIWKVDVDPYAEPGDIVGTIGISYVKDGQSISEAPYPVTVRVAATPLISAPSTEKMTTPSVELAQKTTEKVFDVPFTNTGNVEFTTVTVRLDLDSAMYLKQKSFYYNEDNYASKVYPPLEFTTNDVVSGGDFTATFPAVGLVEMLPPGDYLVPLDYKATYLDPFDDTGAGIRLETMQWDDQWRYDYMEIMWYREDPRPTDLLAPHIMLRVFDDLEGPDIAINSDQVFTAGTAGGQLSVQLVNRELYPITQANLEVGTTSPSLISAAGSGGTGSVFLSQQGVNIPAGTITSPGLITFTSSIDVSGNTNSTGVTCYLRLTGMNDRMEQVELNFTFSVNIKAKPGRISVMAVSTTTIEPGEEFDMTVTVMNTGGVDVTRFEIMLSSVNNLVGVTGANAPGVDIPPGGVRTVSFQCVSSDSFDYEEASQVLVYTSYTDYEGNTVDFMDNAPTVATLMSTRAPEDKTVEEAVSSSGLYLILAFSIPTILICLTILLSVIMFVEKKALISIGGRSKKEGKEAKDEPKDEEKGEEPGESSGSDIGDLLDWADKDQDKPSAPPVPTPPPTPQAAPAGGPAPVAAPPAQNLPAGQAQQAPPK